MKSFIILCGGRSTRMGKDKGSLILNNKPMLLHVMDTISEFADEIILVLRDEEQIKNYSKFLKNNYPTLKIVADKTKDHGPLIGILTGLSYINSKFAQILPCDSPFISRNFILNMFKIADDEKFDAIVPIWDDGHIEPLHSIYKRRIRDNINTLIDHDRMDVTSLIGNIHVRYIAVNELDRTCRSFKNINSAKDL